MNFNKSQTSAIRHKDGAMIVLAGPGSGKTAVITHRTKNLIKEYNIDPKSILVITFTKAAALEMKQRFIQLMGEEKANVNFGTFHAIFFTILKHAYNFSSSNIITEEQRYELMRDIISHYDVEFKDENDFIGNLYSEISQIKNARLDINTYYSNQCGEEIFRNIYNDYVNRLNRSKLIDFDDMLTYTYELFIERKDILAAWQKKFKYILIDEFQDINFIQYEIIKMLALPENNLFIVGDDDQSIYRFRGSKPEIMLNFDKDYPNAKKVILNTNYRCGKYIVETSKNLISNNKKRFEKDIVAAKDDETPVNYITFESRKDENLYLIKDIDSKIKQGQSFNDFAVLFRTNTQPRGLIEQLITYNIPFKIKDYIPNIYEHWIARDLFSYIKIAIGSRERKDFLRIINRPKRYISRNSLYGPYISFDEWIKLYDEQPWIAERIEKLEMDMKFISKMSPYAAINYIRRGIGYDDFLIEFAKYKNINKEEFFDIIDDIQFSAKGYKTFDEWYEHIELYTRELKKQAEKKLNNSNAVTLATMHSSKGLEFENVYIIDANEGMMPYKKAVLEKDIEEERRLFYVGMTRAKTSLSIYSVKSINEKDSVISRFVIESKTKKEEM
ncbi:MAG: ATP-dependent helicase [Agathobacter sp.]|nr:ATP-dependent helicase [Agathobacter sp.]